MGNTFKPPCDEGVILAGRRDRIPSDRAIKRWVLAAAIIGSSLAFSDASSVNVALPALQADLGATVTDVQWVIEAYALFLAALILAGGALGDKFGRRRVFGVGVIVFALASIGCGLAWSVDSLIFWRALQGIGAALLVPGSLAIISVAFDAKERGRAIGTWSGFSAIAAGLGPVLGGWLIDTISWRYIFFINVPFAAAVVAMLFLRVPESRDEQATAPLDGIGAGLATVGLGALVFGFIESGRLGFGNGLVWAALGLGAAGSLAFVWRERRAPAPMMPLSLFRSTNFSGANLLTLLLYAALSGTLFFLPLNLIQVQGYSATAAGAAFVPFILLLFTLSRWSGGLVDRYGPRRPLTIGPVIVAAGFFLFAVQGIGGSYWTTFFPAVVIMGFGMAVCIAPLTTTVMGSVEQRRAGLASGVNNATSRVGGVLAVAVLGIVALAAFNRALDRRLTRLNLPASAWEWLEGERIRLGAAEAPPDLAPQLASAVQEQIAASFVGGFRLVMLIGVVLALASAGIAALMIRDAERPGP